MKVSINHIQETVVRLNYLRERLRRMEDEVQTVQQTLTRMQFGSEANTLAIRASLVAQRDVLRKRIDSMSQMIQVLKQVADEYSQCEKEVQETVGNGMLLWGVTGPVLMRDLVLVPSRYIPRLEELKTIDDFIRPLVVGKKGTT